MKSKLGGPKPKTFKEPKTPSAAAKDNVLGPLGRTPGTPRRPGAVTGEIAREQDSPLDEYKVPKKR